MMTDVTNSAHVGAVVPQKIAGDSISSFGDEGRAKMTKALDSPAPTPPAVSALPTEGGSKKVPEISDAHYPGHSIRIEDLKPGSAVALLEWVARILAEHPELALDLQARAGSHSRWCKQGYA